MREITYDDAPIGNVGRFIGNKPAERWVAYSIHRISVTEANKRGFPSMGDAIKWLVSEHERLGANNG